MSLLLSMGKNLNGSNSFQGASPNTTVVIDESLGFKSESDDQVVQRIHTVFGGDTAEEGSLLQSNGPGLLPSYGIPPSSSSPILYSYTTMPYFSLSAPLQFRLHGCHVFSPNVKWFEVYMCGGGGAAAWHNQLTVPAVPRKAGGAGGGAATGYLLSTNVPAYGIAFVLGAGGEYDGDPTGLVMGETFNGDYASRDGKNSVLGFLDAYFENGGVLYNLLTAERGIGGEDIPMIADVPSTSGSNGGRGGGHDTAFHTGWSFVYPGDDGETGWVSQDEIVVGGLVSENQEGGNRGGRSFFGSSTGTSQAADQPANGSGGGNRTGAIRSGGNGYIQIIEHFI